VSGRRPIDAAIVYASRGWPVFPVHHPFTIRGAVRCSCGALDCSSIGKHPHTRDGLKSATLDRRQIELWWARWRSAGVAIATGGAARLVVIDIDPDKGGEASLNALIAEHGPLPPGRRIATGGGGAHYYFRHDGDPLHNTTGHLGPGIDTRADGGYVIAPPSRHRSGREYKLVSGGQELPRLPMWLLQLLEPPPRQPGAVQEPPADATRWAQAAVDGEVTRLRTAAEGTRNDTLNRVAFRLGQIIGSGALHENDVEPLLIEQGIAIGLREREVVRTVHSGLRAGEGSPRGPTGASLRHSTADPDPSACP